MIVRAGRAACWKRDSEARLYTQIGSVSKPMGRSKSATGSSLRASTPTSTAAVSTLAHDSGRWIRPTTTWGRAPSERAEAVTSSGIWPRPDSTELRAGAWNRMAYA